MFTDPRRIRFSDPGHPEECNVFSYYRVFTEGRERQVRAWCKSAQKGCTDCKRILAEGLVEYLKPHQEKRAFWIKNKRQLSKILNRGRQRAAEVAGSTIKEIKEITGILYGL